MKKVLVLRPYSRGGVSIFYNSIEPFLTNDFVFASSESEKHSAIGMFLKTLSNFIKLPYLLYSNKIDLVIVNPSLNKNSFIRDGIYLLISNLMRKKTVVFWRGWDRKNEYLLTKRLWSSFFNVTFRRAHSTFVLDSYVEKKLRSEFNI